MVDFVNVSQVQEISEWMNEDEWDLEICENDVKMHPTQIILLQLGNEAELMWSCDSRKLGIISARPIDYVFFVYQKRRR